MYFKGIKFNMNRNYLLSKLHNKHKLRHAVIGVCHNTINGTRN